MMAPVARVIGNDASATAGHPRLDPAKALWNGAMLAGTVFCAVPLFEWTAFALYLGLTYATLLVGHSVGMHRMMIHRSFRCAKPLERLLISIGVLVGVAGPYGILRVHDLRDWAQRQPASHPFFAHTAGLAQDLLWQLACRFEFDRPPQFRIEPDLADDRFYRFLERTWRWQQLPFAALLYALGGWSFVAWGICARVFTSVAGHWTVTHFCHRPGHGRWTVRGASVQAADLPGLGLLTYGECWHNNHHAFPESARIGLERGQADPAWWLIAALERLGWARDVGRPRPAAAREDLVLR